MSRGRQIVIRAWGGDEVDRYSATLWGQISHRIRRRVRIKLRDHAQRRRRNPHHFRPTLSVRVQPDPAPASQTGVDGEHDGLKRGVIYFGREAFPALFSFSGGPVGRNTQSGHEKSPGSSVDGTSEGTGPAGPAAPGSAGPFGDPS